MKQKWITLASLAMLLVLVFSAGLATPAMAAEIDPDGLVAAGETVNDDLITSAENVRVDGVINGNLLASGQTVTINGTVNGDALIGANNFILTENAVITGNLFVGTSVTEIRGRVQGSVFGGSTAVLLKSGAQVGRNLFYGAYAMQMDKGSSVGMDVFAGMYQAALNGNVGRNMNMGAGAVELGGETGGNVTLDLGEESDTSGAPTFMPMMPFAQQPGVPAPLQPGLRVAGDALIGGKLTYTSGQNFASGIQSQPAGGVIHLTPVPSPEPEAAQKEQPQTPAALTWLLKLVRSLITLLVLGFLLVRFAPALLQRILQTLRARAWASLGYGALTLVLGYLAFGLALAVLMAVVMLLGALTLGQLSGSLFWVGFSALLLAVSIFTVLLLFASRLVAAQLAGEWLAQKFIPAWSGKAYHAMALGVLVYVLLAALPFIGWIFALLASAAGMGALWLAWRAPKTTTIAE